MSAHEDENLITVLVTHPDEAARGALVARLRADDEIEVVDERERATLDDVLLLMPDVVVVATGHPDLDGTALINQTHDEAPVITVVAALVGDDGGFDALSAGALSCLAADDPEPEAGVKAAWRGESHLSQGQAADLLADFDRVADRFGDAEHRPTLTATEREVLERLAKGEGSGAIADEYEVTDRLVNLHAGYAVGKVHWALDAERRLARLAEAAPPGG
jgi:two-component system nitrate/nitrite response regulator NarL